MTPEDLNPFFLKSTGFTDTCRTCGGAVHSEGRELHLWWHKVMGQRKDAGARPELAS